MTFAQIISIKPIVNPKKSFRETSIRAVQSCNTIPKRPNTKTPKEYCSKAKRWTSPQRPDAAVLRNTKSEAIVWFQQLLGVETLPDGFEIEVF